MCPRCTTISESIKNHLRSIILLLLHLNTVKCNYPIVLDSGMALFLKNVAFHGILLDALFEEGNREWEEVSELLKKGIASGVVQPLRTTVFERNQVEDAFRYMAQGKHIGKVLLQVRAVVNLNEPAYKMKYWMVDFSSFTVLIAFLCFDLSGTFRGDEQHYSCSLSSFYSRYLPYLLPCLSLIHHHWRSGWFRLGVGPVAH